MSKTFIYTLVVIGVYILIVYPNRKNKQVESDQKTEEKTENKSDTKNSLGLNENADENGVSQGASGQLKYRIGGTL